MALLGTWHRRVWILDLATPGSATHVQEEKIAGISIRSAICREALFHSEEYESAIDAFNEGIAIANARVKPNIEKWVAATQQRMNGVSVDLAALRPFSAAANAKDKGHVPAPPPTAIPTPKPEPDQPAADPDLAFARVSLTPSVVAMSAPFPLTFS